MDKVYIFGHKNPDTDSVTSAISLAYFKRMQGVNAEPRVLGAINAETLYALDQFGVEAPRYLNDVKIKVKNVNFNENYKINECDSIIDAFNFMNNHSITGLPLVDSSSNFKGYVSLKEIAADMIYNESMHINTSFDNLLKVLDADDYCKVDDHIEGYARTVTFDDSTFINDVSLDKNSILILGDRTQIIDHALKIGIKLLIMVNSKKLSDDQLEIAAEKGTNIIFSRKSSFEIVRVLCLANPIKSIKRKEKCVTFNVNDYLSDVKSIIDKFKHTNYGVLNADDVCVGMLRSMDVNKVNKKKVILVDHNTFSQSADGLGEADIIEIVDHHNLGDIVTSTPINVRSMAVGSTNTIVYHMYNEHGVDIPKDIAGIMLSGILSDTLCLKSPTTTKVDIDVANKLAKITGVNIDSYGVDLLASGVSIEGLSANEIIMRDCKKYEINGQKIFVAQVFTTDFKDYTPRIDELVNELNNEAKSDDFRICALFVTDFFTHNSYLIYSDNSEDVLKSAYDIEELQQGYMLEGVVSRKKQMVPFIMDALER